MEVRACKVTLTSHYRMQRARYNQNYLWMLNAGPLATPLFDTALTSWPKNASNPTASCNKGNRKISLSV